MLKIDNLTKRFSEVVAVNNLTLEIPKGVTGLVGHNGAGKSTLLRLISGIYDADEGLITLDGIESNTKEGKSKVFFLCDDPYCEGNSNIKQVKGFYKSFFNIDDEKFDRLIGTFGLPTNRRVNNFSKGMRRQLFIALALSSDAEYLLLDEAFDGLDPLVLENIKDEIVAVANEEKTVIVSSHNIASLERLCDRFVILHRGEIGKQGETEDLGHSFNKYQAMFTKETKKEDIEALGIEVLAFKKVGSIYNFVIIGDGLTDIIKEKLQPTLLESVVINPDEIIALEMLLAKKGDK